MTKDQVLLKISLVEGGKYFDSSLKITGIDKIDKLNSRDVDSIRNRFQRWEKMEYDKLH